ncbi:hypothetical protein CQW23_35634 [Capsicum baccatum]|uniref:Pentatricopeptide repeat-containing protein n=1 Tax=Capsicum baccatum TaxID=33114 RepID=A0A2G2UVC5_CAPBA|nr:hypothetical protein CQW23_35634 [Capsicum baccatum]
MKKKGIPPVIVTYSSLIDGLCKLGQWEKVKTLLSEMVNLNIYPNVLTFSIQIDGLCKEGKVEDAEEVMRHMIEKGVEPNIITYNVIMDGYCLRGQVDRARRVFDIMIDKCIEPDIFSYSILINGYFPLSRSEKCIVGTGLERQAALDSGALAIAEREGRVVYTNTDTCLNTRKINGLDI